MFFILYNIIGTYTDPKNAYVPVVHRRPRSHSTKLGVWTGHGMGKAIAQVRQRHSFATGTAKKGFQLHKSRRYA